MVKRIQQENNMVVNTQTLQAYTATLGDNFLTYKWKPTDVGTENTLVTFNEDYVITVGDFNEYLKKNSRDRIRMGKATAISDAVDVLFANFIGDQTLKYEEMQR